MVGAAMIGSGVRLVCTAGEATALLGLGRSTAYDLIARCELKAVRLGRRVFITRLALTQLLGCRRVHAGPGAGRDGAGHDPEGADAGSYCVKGLPRYYLDANEPPGR
jgi:excisionase family DNA binding protein